MSNQFHYEDFKIRETGKWTRRESSATTFSLPTRIALTVPAIVIWALAVRAVSSAEGPMAALLMIVVGVLTIVVFFWVKEIWQKGWTRR